MMRLDSILVVLVALGLAAGCGDDLLVARQLPEPMTGEGDAGGNDTANGGAGEPGIGGSGGLAEGGSGGIAAGGSGGLAEGGSGGIAAGGSGGLADGGSGGGGSGGYPLRPGDWVPTGGPFGLAAEHLFVTSSGTIIGGSGHSPPEFPGQRARSTDGGVTWSKEFGDLPGTWPITEVNGTLFTVHDIALYASTDDGITWTERQSFWIGNRPGPVAGPDGLLWAVTSTGTILSSADDGITWIEAGALATRLLHDLKIFGAGGLLYVQANGLFGFYDGATWTDLTNPGEILQLVAHDGSLYVHVFEFLGPNLRSDDGGLTWLIDSPAPQALPCPFYPLGSTLYTVAGGDILERTASGWIPVGEVNFPCPRAAGGGSIWEVVGGGTDVVTRWDAATATRSTVQIQSANAPMRSLSGNDQVLIGNDRYGSSFRSVDGGASWQRIQKRHLDRFVSLGGTVWLAGVGPESNPGSDFPAPEIVLSPDNGASWRIEFVGQAWSFAPAGTDLIMAGENGLYRSTAVAGGRMSLAWQAGLRGSFRELWRDGSTLYATGFGSSSLDARTWRSTDDGVSFSEVVEARFSHGIVRAGNRLVALGTSGPSDSTLDIWHSHDGGLTWQRAFAALPYPELGNLVSNGTDLFLLERGSWTGEVRSPTVWHSADAGLTWAALGSELPGTVTGIVATSNGLFVSVEGASVWKWSPTP